MLVGQAPAFPRGPEGRPFGFGGGRRRLFDWLAQAGFGEEEFRSKAYMTSITKCYPGPSPSGKGDRRPGKDEIEACRSYFERELEIIRPELLIPVGQLAIGVILGEMKLSDAVGRRFERESGGWSSIVIPLPHPSGANLWNNAPENQKLIATAISLISDARMDLRL